LRERARRAWVIQEDARLQVWAHGLNVGVW